uniref:hypothetical protein n=1 Tax=Edaphosphingomonas laterariae TaxID=861865 RepID=UPI001181C440|nr:hypothetical protein [Sphingomonas laterariae]
MWEAAKAEFEKSPIATTMGIVGGIAGILSIIIALVGPTQPIPTLALEPSAASPAWSSYLLVIGAFLSLTIAGATASRFVIKYSDVAAFFTSLVLACLTSILSAIVANAYQVRFFRSGQSVNVDTTVDVIFWGTLFIFLAITAEDTFKSFATLAVRKDDGKNRMPESDVIGSLALLLLVALIWAALLREGQRLILGTFLH